MNRRKKHVVLRIRRFPAASTPWRNRLRGMLYLFLLGILPVAAAGPPDSYRVLFLARGMELPPWNLAMFSECRTEFERLSGRPVSMAIASLADNGSGLPLSGRTEGARFMVYRNPLSPPPLRLAAETGIPLVVPTCDTAWLPNADEIPPNAYLGTVTLSPDRTARLAKPLCPWVRKLIVIAGDHETDRFFMRRAREQLGERFDGLAVEYWEGVAPGELNKRVAALPGDHAILFLKMTHDPSGAIYISSDIARDLAAYSPVPVFGVSDSFLEAGILGGYVVSSRIEGRRAAQMLARLAVGEALPAIEHVADYGEYQFNWNEMKRWGIRERHLPAGSRILNRPDNFFGRHPWILWITLSLVTLLPLVIGTALLLLRNRQKTLVLMRDNQQWLKLSTEMAGVAIWEYDVENNRMARSENHDRLHGMEPQENWTAELFLKAMHPDDRDRTKQTMDRAMAPGGPARYRCDYRTIWPDGSEHWLSVIGEIAERNAEGSATRLHGCLIDIDDRKQVEKVLRESEERARLMAELVENSDQPVGIGFADGRLGRFNPAFCKLTGYTKEELQAMDWAADLTPPEWLPAEREALAELERTGEPVRYEKEYIRKDGSRVPIELFVHLARKPDGTPDFYYAFITDITTRRQAKEEMKRRQYHLENAQLLGKIGSWDLDMQQNALTWTDENYHVFGLPVGTPLTYETFLNRVHPDDREQVDRQWNAAVRGEDAYDIEHRLMMDDGEVKWVREKADMVFDGNGKCLRGMGFTQDITDLKRAEAALRQNEQRYQSLFDHSPVPLWEEDLSEVKRYIEALKKDGVRNFREYWKTHPEAVVACAQRVKVTEVNSAALALHEAPSWSALLEGLPSIFTEKSYEVFAEQLLAIAEGRTAHTASSTVKTLTGKLRSILLRWSVVPGHENTLDRVYISTIDVTAQQQAEEALRIAHDQLEARVKERTAELKIRTDEAETLNRAMINLLQDLKEMNRGLEQAQHALRTSNSELEAFSYSVSHDLRAPLRHINGFVSLLLKRETNRLDATSARYLDTIARAADRMGRLIDDLLSFSRTGRTEMHLQPVAPNEIVEAAMAELAPAMNDRRIAWKIGVLPAVQADRGLLLLVWQNLLGNAIKYTGPREEACIEIGAEQSGQVEGSEEITFFIRDNGVGFDPQYADKLFGVFQRLHRDDEFEGTGIGLATVRRIIHRHGGRVWAEGKTDQGATFYFTLDGTNGAV